MFLVLSEIKFVLQNADFEVGNKEHSLPDLVFLLDIEFDAPCISSIYFHWFSLALGPNVSKTLCLPMKIGGGTASREWIDTVGSLLNLPEPLDAIRLGE